MNVFEFLMLVCFGVSWPISIAKTLRTKVVEGKSPLFMVIVCVGYLFGLIHKYLDDWDWVAGLYVVNLAVVLADLGLYFHYRMPRDTRRISEKVSQTAAPDVGFHLTDSSKAC